MDTITRIDTALSLRLHHEARVQRARTIWRLVSTLANRVADKLAAQPSMLAGRWG